MPLHSTHGICIAPQLPLLSLCAKKPIWQSKWQSLWPWGSEISDSTIHHVFVATMLDNSGHSSLKGQITARSFEEIDKLVSGLAGKRHGAPDTDDFKARDAIFLHFIRCPEQRASSLTTFSRECQSTASVEGHRKRLSHRAVCLFSANHVNNCYLSIRSTLAVIRAGKAAPSNHKGWHLLYHLIVSTKRMWFRLLGDGISWWFLASKGETLNYQETNGCIVLYIYI